jgi:hypothetical protein
VGSTIGDSSLPFSGTVQCSRSALQKHSFISPNIEMKSLWSRVPNGKLRVTQQVIVRNGG